MWGLNRLKRYVEENCCVAPNANAAILRDIAINAPPERLSEALTNPERRLKCQGAEGRCGGRT